MLSANSAIAVANGFDPDFYAAYYRIKSGRSHRRTEFQGSVSG